MVDMRVSERREKGVDRKQQPTEAIGLDPTPRVLPSTRRAWPAHTCHSPHQ